MVTVSIGSRVLLRSRTRTPSNGALLSSPNTNPRTFCASADAEASSELTITRTVADRRDLFMPVKLASPFACENVRIRKLPFGLS